MKKIIIVLVCLLFVGVSIIPSTNGIPIPIQSKKVSDVNWRNFSIAGQVLRLEDVTKQWNETLETYEYTGTLIGGFIIIWMVFRFPPFGIPFYPGQTVTVSKNASKENFITHVAITELPGNRLFFRLLTIGFVGDFLLYHE